MSAIKAKNTKPEVMFRKFIYRLGLRYRLHTAKLPGKPDLYIKKYNTVIFIHGCFWHQHENCKDANIPKSNIEFWQTKLSGNVVRDKANISKLKELGYKVMIVWQCEILDKGKKVIKSEYLLNKLQSQLKI